MAAADEFPDRLQNEMRIQPNTTVYLANAQKGLRKSTTLINFKWGS